MFLYDRSIKKKVRNFHGSRLTRRERFTLDFLMGCKDSSQLSTSLVKPTNEKFTKKIVSCIADEDKLKGKLPKGHFSLLLPSLHLPSFVMLETLLFDLSHFFSFRNQSLLLLNSKPKPMIINN